MTEVCLVCQRSVSVDSGLYVDRLLADDGYICRECQIQHCENCEMPYDDLVLSNGKMLCPKCLKENNE